MTFGERVLRVGTRRSPLARAQTEMVRRMLAEEGFESEAVPMFTRGDSGLARLTAGGVKGSFVDEIAAALVDGVIDVAVHSAKDLPAFDAADTIVGAVPQRAAAHDVLVSRGPVLGPGARIGTSSLRRRAQLKRSRPHLTVCETRGNVGTRLARLEAGELDGLVLAGAGLGRLGIDPPHAEVLATSEMLPAPGQGFLAVQTRAGGPALDAVSSLDCHEARRAWEAERHLVRLLGADCALPLGAYARYERELLTLDAAVLSADGSEAITASAHGRDFAEVAGEAAGALLERGAGALLEPYAGRAEAG